MKRRRGGERSGIAPALFTCLAIGAGLGWWLRGVVPTDLIAIRPSVPAVDREREPEVARAHPSEERPRAEKRVTEGDPVHIVPTIGIDPIAELRRHGLRLPLDDARVEAMKGNFDQRRGGGRRGHEAVDLMAPRLTPVRAVEEGTIARLFYSQAGGITIYQFDPERQFCYYYAHLERYAAGLKEGQRVSAGDVIGYVGSSGNAAENAPHLHFAIFRLNDDKRWWDGTPIDPYEVFRSG